MPANTASTDSTQRDLHAITRDGVFFSIMVGLGETYVPAFAIAIGLGDVLAGLISTLPMLIGACLQLVTPRAVRWTRSYRRWVVICAAVQAFSFAPLVVGALAGKVHLAWVAVATVTYWAAGMSAGPPWNTWVSTLVPVETRATFFAYRARACQVALVIGLLLGGWSLDFGRDRGVVLPVFASLFAAALVARLVSTRYLASQSERPGIISEHKVLGPKGVWRTLRGADSLRVLRYLLIMQAAAHIAAPYFTPYMLLDLAMPYDEFMALTAAAFVARIGILPLLGRVASRHQARRVLWIGGLGIVPLPALWLLSDNFIYLLAVQIAAGCAWAAIELATTLSYFEGIKEEERTSILSTFNLANAFAIAIGSLIGALILRRFEASQSAYVYLFATSSAMRLFAAILLPGTPTASRLSTTVLRTLALRPGGVAVQRPVTASLEDTAPVASDPPRNRESGAQPE